VVEFENSEKVTLFSFNTLLFFCIARRYQKVTFLKRDIVQLVCLRGWARAQIVGLKCKCSELVNR